MPSAFEIINRSTHRAPVNPFDKCTIISIYPKKIKERKLTIQPGYYVIEPGSYQKPSFTVISPASWWKDMGFDQPLLEIPISSIQVAESIVKDYCNGIVGWNPSNAGPGLFYIPGEINLVKLMTEYKGMLEAANERQKNWYEYLVNMADVNWSRANGNPLAVMEESRMAARELGYEDKPWLKNSINAVKVRCKGCGSLKDPQYPICPTCKSIDNPELATKLGIKTAS